MLCSSPLPAQLDELSSKTPFSTQSTQLILQDNQADIDAILTPDIGFTGGNVAGANDASSSEFLNNMVEPLRNTTIHVPANLTMWLQQNHPIIDDLLESLSTNDVYIGWSTAQGKPTANFIMSVCIGIHLWVSQEPRASYTWVETLVHSPSLQFEIFIKEQVDERIQSYGLNTLKGVDSMVDNARYAIFGKVEGILEDAARLQGNSLTSSSGYLCIPRNWSSLVSAIRTVKIVREVNKKGQGAGIFNVSPAGGFSGSPGLAFYSAAKFALEGFTETFCKELSAEWNVKNCILGSVAFETAWQNTFNRFPQHPAFVRNPADFCSLRGSITMLDDPAKAAKALITLSRETKLPTRVQLVIREADKFSEISRMTDREGMRGVACGEMIVNRLQGFHNA
ncbi:LOW QUALITY PROTEIN: hypothetical protein CVT26_014313 [Gymnopilus dilepis]|uniref:Uncharacterized protein n=1 Tax=Gymnopilus dilepis TaxID=231916 RepID=A0A409Y7B0_9AGAR|nr:LOW QUALITY PROTEIN: hypothetical protein CVT26_014313 [Gymnopilus dilepis]